MKLFICFLNYILKITMVIRLSNMSSEHPMLYFFICLAIHKLGFIYFYVKVLLTHQSNVSFSECCMLCENVVYYCHIIRMPLHTLSVMLIKDCMLECL